MRIRVKLTLEEIASGVEKKIKVPRKVQAPEFNTEIVQHVMEPDR